MAENNQIKESLFGGVEKIKATGDHIASREELSKPISEGALMRAFCRGCGTLAEINGDLAEEYAKNSGVNLPENSAGFYFESAGCALCDSPDSSVELKAIER